MDDPLPPSYDATQAGGDGGVGQLIDLGTDITTSPAASLQQPPPAGGERSDDIVAQLAQMGVTPATGGAPQQQGTRGGDEFDMFAESRTVAYGNQQQGLVVCII